MIDDEREERICMMLRVALEAQTWAAAIKGLLVAKGITTDEEFARYVGSDGSGQIEPSDEPPLDCVSEVNGLVH